MSARRCTMVTSHVAEPPAVQLLDAARAMLLVIDVQQRLMPAIDAGHDVVAATGRLLAAARLLQVPRLFTEQNPSGLGVTEPSLSVGSDRVFEKMAFGACAEPGFGDLVPGGAQVVVCGCEAHVCVLQTVIGLRTLGHPVAVVTDAVGSRRAADRHAGLARMAAAGAQLVTSEMVIFEWLGSARHPRFREAHALVK